MDRTVLDWLLEDINPEVRLRTLKEYEHLPDKDEKVIACKKDLIGSKSEHGYTIPVERECGVSLVIVVAYDELIKCHGFACFGQIIRCVITEFARQSKC